MPTYLNEYGLVAFASDRPLTLDEVCASLNMRVDMGNVRFLKEAMRELRNSVGIYNGRVLFCTDDPMRFFRHPLCELTERLLRAFPDGRGCAVYYYSVASIYGYAYFENGKVRRMKHGDHNLFWEDFGNLLPCEEPQRSNTDALYELVRIVTGDKLPDLAGKDIPMYRSQLMDY
ncbi:MAG: hypothetical protein JNM91_14440 [Flavobacteriales bacterium]|nr:hypothetical protein [Flavobacteriales bacterium]